MWDFLHAFNSLFVTILLFLLLISCLLNSRGFKYHVRWGGGGCVMMGGGGGGGVGGKLVRGSKDGWGPI